MGFIRKRARKVVDRIARFAGDQGETLRMFDSLGYFPNLLWPRSFSEKVVRRKLHAPAMWSEFADKVRVRDYVASRIGEGYLNPLHLVTTTPEEIDIASLPDRFVVKANHGSGWNLMVTDKGAITESSIRARCGKWLEKRYGLDTHEGWYASIRPRILVERFIEDRTYGVPLDFKIWVFHGIAQFVQVDFGRFATHTRTFYDRHWRRQRWGVGFPLGPDVGRPKKLDEMFEVAEQLSSFDPDFVRVDPYSPDDATVLFGELTFAPGAGWERFTDTKADYRLGAYW